MSAVIKLSSPSTHEFWEVPIVYEDAHLLALDKPAGLPVSPDRADPNRPNLIQLLHAGIAEGKGWAKERELSYLMNAHRLEPDTSGVLLLARQRSVFSTLANIFGAEKPVRRFLALVHGSPAQDRFEVNARLAPHPVHIGLVHVDARHGKRSHTRFEVLERFLGWTLLRCEALTGRPYQIQVHLRSARLPIVGDALYGGKPLLLSRLKRNYHLKPKQVERPLINRTALHAEQLSLPHPVTGQPLVINAPWPKHLMVAVKYLRRYATPQGETFRNEAELE